MIDGQFVVDAHVHTPRLPTLKQAWLDWARDFARDYPWRTVYDEAGAVVPSAMDDLMEREGVDRVLLFCEYSPRATGIQSIEDNLPLVEYNPERFRLVANVNPHLHHPLREEVQRQLSLGAVALKLHPVHGAFSPADKELYPVYELCAERGVPVVLHSGLSVFPGSRASFGDPQLLSDVVEDFPTVNFVFAHGGRGWWYDVAAFMAQSRPNVWLDLAGLPPKKLPEYYARFDLVRLARKWIFGTDWPGVPGTAVNVRAVADLGLPEEVLRGVLSGNALRLMPGLA
ncbi:amidohydrolase family protein [Amycolatopsis jiangsuensis]|uniref:Putative TIM-barrel fold metal-dependent hydrolase n=1 Tax=Amycolatopsis jiangsuensis TaxID=1181879 RepID=A0A840J2C2_9PSEU|nr:amidohydrolase family protein [Amycolatopsis jiangsuensis]MBB4687889.1 putative TIM-barrel fold metal-dependent hydrolase [Amycolatopsis jiangsuensis]